MVKVDLKRAVGLNRALRVGLSLCLLFVLYSATSFFRYRPPKSSKINKEFTIFSHCSGNNGPAYIQVENLERQRQFPCNDFTPSSFLGKRGSFWVLYNYVMPTCRFACDESVTYATPADHTYLDNLIPLVERWLGPVSVSVYTPGTDYYETLLRINYLRECSPLVKVYVSFHFYFDNTQAPHNLSSSAEKAFAKMLPVNCSMPPSFGPNVTTFRKTRKLSYPINIGRNVARETASTHYVMVSDIELYPSPNLIPDFLEMIRRDGKKLKQIRNPIVFVLPQIELNSTVSALPYDKIELQKMLNETVAIPFRIHICPNCFSIPKLDEWKRANVTEGLNVFTVGKRLEKQWEPTYIGTKSDPMYDERLTWEGGDDRVVQAYIMCVLDYEFHILDNAFLVHRPGIKKRVEHKWTTPIQQQHDVITETIEPELNSKYGHRPECLLSYH